MKLFSRRRQVPVLALCAALLPAVALAATGAMPSVGATRHSHGGRPPEVSITDVTINVPHQDPIQAWVVAPAGNLHKRSVAGVLWLHWLGDLHNDRSEFLSEAVDLAGQGVVSVLPQGYFPWVPNPDGTAGDVTLVRNQVAAYKAALDQLAAQPGRRSAIASQSSATTTAPCTAPCWPTATTGCPCWPCRHRTR